MSSSYNAKTASSAPAEVNRRLNVPRWVCVRLLFIEMIIMISLLGLIFTFTIARPPE